MCQLDSKRMEEKGAYLDGTALPLSLQGIFKLKVELRFSCVPLDLTAAAYLGTVECSVLGVHLPLTRESLFQDRLERRLCLVPDGEVTHPLAGITGRQADLVVESEWLVDSIKEVESVLDLLLDLVDRTEDVR